MSRGRFALLILISVVIASAIKLDRMTAYERQSALVAELACDIVTTRAQAGSTRDVHDQIFSFLRGHSPDSRAEVVIRSGDREIGSRTTGDGTQKIDYTCKIQNAGDYEIIISVARPRFFDKALAKYAFLSLLSLLALVTFAWITAQLGRRMLESRFTELSLEEIGLQNPREGGAKFPRGLVRILLWPFRKIAPRIRNLKLDLEKTEKELLVAQDLLAQLDAEKARADRFGDVVKQVRHDLKGPLSVLKIASGQKDKSERRDILPNVVASIEKMLLDLDKEMRSDARSESDKQIDLAEVLILESVRDARTRIPSNRGITISFNYDKSRLSPILCRPDYFVRVISNLLQNAIEAVGDVGKIDVRVSRVSTAELLIEIEDNGAGVDPAIAVQLFEKGATFGKISGTGLGLSFAKVCIEKWSGSIRYDLSHSGGARFKISMPIATTNVNFQSSAPESAEIAILDDQIELFEGWWRARSSTAKMFSSPDDFLDWFDQLGPSRPACVIDLHLNHAANGIDIVRTLGAGSDLYLATSDYLNPEALEVAATYKMPIMPKSLLFSEP